MGRNSSSPPAILDDNGGADLGFHSIRDRFPFKRNPNPIHQRDRPRGLFTDRQPFPRPPPRSHHRFYRKGLLCLFPFKGKSAFYAVLIFALFVFAVATMLLQSSMTLVFRQGSERGRLLREGLKFGSTLRFMPGRVSKRVVEGDGLDRARNEARIGVRPPRLALILGNMKKDPQSLMLITVMKNIKKLGYELKIFSVANGKAHKMWEQFNGQISILAPESYGLIDWSIFGGVIADSLEAKESISSLMQEPFCSVPLIWIIQEDTLANRLPVYEEMGLKNLISHWKSAFSRANIVVFPDFTLPMLYSVLDTGNFFVIPGSPVDVWAAERYRKTHSKNQLRKINGFSEDDMLVVVVGSSFFYDELSWDYAVAMHSIGPLLIKYARRDDAGEPFKFVFLCGNSSDDAFQEVTSHLGLLHGSVRHYGLNGDVNSVLLMADIVLYGSSQDVQGFPPLLIRAMTFGIPVIAPDFLVLKKYVVDGVHMIFFPKHNPDALMSAFSLMISNGKLSKFARTVASSGRLLATNLLASECITGYARLLENVLNFPSDALLPGPISQLQQATWEWNLLGNEIDYRTENVMDIDEQSSWKNTSVVNALEEDLLGFGYSPNISENVTWDSALDIPTQLDWDLFKEIVSSEEYETLEMEELSERMEKDPGLWDDIYRNARKAEKLRFEANERDEGELERTGQTVCIYEIYSGSGTWPFLHHGSLYRGLSLSKRTQRSTSDDVDAVDRLPVLNETYYRNILCEIGGMFAIANKVDSVHKRPWIGFQSWRAAGSKVALSKKAERVLEEAIQDNTKGDVIYFWGRLNMNGGVTGSKDALTFWSACDILNEGHCRNVFEDAFRWMYNLPSNTEALPPMPEDGGHWSALHSWVMPTRSFVEFVMFSRMFVESLDALHANSGNRSICLLGSSELEKKHCYCRVLEVLVNVWAYHSGRKMVFIDPISGALEGQHPVELRKGFMWAKYFDSTLLKSMDEDSTPTPLPLDPPSAMVEIDELAFPEDEERSRVFTQLKAYCFELLELLQNPKKHSSALSSLLHFLRQSPPHALQPFFDYTLFPLLLLLDAAFDCRTSKKLGSEEKLASHNVPKMPQKVSDSVAEGVLQCLEELLKKCLLGSVDQLVVVLKKLTYGALLSPSDASEEFREGIIKCFRELLLNLLPCSDESCACKRIFGVPMLLENSDLKAPLSRTSKYDSEPDECLLAFLQSQTASAAVGHWLSLLLKAADNEAARGHLGSAKLRIEAFMTLRVLVAKVGTADALAFFLPGVVSQFAKVLHASKTMTSGAAGSGDAIDQAIRALAEYLMIVLRDDANLTTLDMSITVSSDLTLKKNESTQSFLDELRKLPVKAHGQSKMILENSSSKVITTTSNCEKKTDSGKGDGSLHVDRTSDWIEKTSMHVDKLLGATFRHICIHPAKKVRQGLLAAIRGLLSKCSYMLRQSRQTLLECLCALAVDDSVEVSAGAQEFLENLFSSIEDNQLEHDVAQMFSRLIDKLPKVVLGSEESLAVSQAQQLLVIMYYSGPQFVVDHILQSPVTATRFLDHFSVCMSQNSVFAGSLDKLLTTRPSSVGYLDSVSELNAGASITSECLTIVAAAPRNSKIAGIQEKDIPSTSDNVQKNYENYKLPRMPPWFVYIGSQKLYQTLSGILRLVGLSLMTDKKHGQHLSHITDIPVGYLRKLVSEVRMKDYNKVSWHSWYNRTGSGQLLRQASTAVCILNEMIFGMSDQATDIFARMFQKARKRRKEVQDSDAGFADGQPFKVESSMLCESSWNVLKDEELRSHLIDCVGRILLEYLSHEVWDLPTEHKSSSMHLDYEAEDINLNFFQDTAMLHQVIIEGIGIISICLGGDFASSGFLHQSLYMLLENLTSSNYRVRSASDGVLHILAAVSGFPTVGHLVLANADYVIDSICRQLRHLEINPHVPNVLAAMLSYIGVAYKILPLFEEPMRSVSLELEILGRHQHPELTISFLKAVAEISKASKREACSLPTQAESYLLDVKARISDIEKKDDDDIIMSQVESEQWDSIMFKLNDSKRYRRTVGAIAGSCIMAATPLLASAGQEACLVALDIIEDGVTSLAKVEEAYHHEKATKEAIEEVIQSYSLYHLQDALDAADEGADENRLLPAVNKIWPFLVVCIQNKNPLAVRRCLSVVSNVVQICGGDFFSRRFQTDGLHFWKLLSTSPFHRKPNMKEERTPLLLPYRSTSSSSEESLAETSNLKVQVAVLNMVAELSRNERSASALEVVLKKVSGLVVGIACSGVVGLRDASINALQGLASVDADLIWLLLADVYYSMKKKDMPSPPTSDIPVISQILPPPSSAKEYLYVQYGGQSYGFDIDFSSVEIVFKKLHSLVFINQMYS